MRRQPFFPPLPTVLKVGMSDDEKLTAAWEGVPTDQIRRCNPYLRPSESREEDLKGQKVEIARRARERIIAIREGRTYG